MKETIKIDVSKVLKAKMPKYYRFVPSFLVKWLENIIHQDELNYLLLKNKDLEGVDFANAILSDLDIKLEVVNSHLLPAKGSGKYIFASNHPLGGLDGMALISLLGKQYDNNIKFIVNDMLSQLTPFADIFLPANKVGRQSHEVAEKINAAFMSDAQVITFPAGLCSRRKNDGRVSDLDWTKGFISKSDSKLLYLYFTCIIDFLLSSNFHVKEIRRRVLNTCYQSYCRNIILCYIDNIIQTFIHIDLT